MGSVGSLLSGAGNLLGGFLGGDAGAARNAKDFMDRGARDEAPKKASAEIMPLFTRCPKSNNWVDQTCWNEARGLCVNCAPNLATEMEATRAQVEIQQMQEAMQTQQVFSGDLGARNTVCPNCGKPVGSEKFCSNGGAPTGQNKCSGCGNDIAAGARFCGNYGKPT